MFGPNEHPWLDPLWRRIAIVIVCAAWTVFEYRNDQQTWAFLFLAITAYAIWALIITYKGSENIGKDQNSESDNQSS